MIGLYIYRINMVLLYCKYRVQSFRDSSKLVQVDRPVRKPCCASCRRLLLRRWSLIVPDCAPLLTSKFLHYTMWWIAPKFRLLIYRTWHHKNLINILKNRNENHNWSRLGFRRKNRLSLVVSSITVRKLLSMYSDTQLWNTSRLVVLFIINK